MTSARTTALSLAEFAEPRIEPEIVFGLYAAPAADMDEAALLSCLDWVAHEFEIVQSIYPHWKFQAPDTVAANGVHGALLIGPRRAIRPRATEWQAMLPRFEIDLSCRTEPGLMVYRRQIAWSCGQRDPSSGRAVGQRSRPSAA